MLHLCRTTEVEFTHSDAETAIAFDHEDENHIYVSQMTRCTDTTIHSPIINQLLSYDIMMYMQLSQDNWQATIVTLPSEVSELCSYAWMTRKLHRTEQTVAMHG